LLLIYLSIYSIYRWDILLSTIRYRPSENRIISSISF